MSTPKTKIRTWYLSKYPSDELGKELHEGTTFQGLFSDMDAYQNVYDTLGVTDSIIRERVFEELAKIMKVPYSYVYDQFLLTH
jgi:hypothetical protein